jgi:hypothetical protein
MALRAGASTRHHAVFNIKLRPASTMREGVTADSGGAREQIIGVHSGAKIAKKPFLGVAHMVKNCSYTKKTKITPGPVHPPR